MTNTELAISMASLKTINVTKISCNGYSERIQAIKSPDRNTFHWPLLFLTGRGCTTANSKRNRSGGEKLQSMTQVHTARQARGVGTFKKLRQHQLWREIPSNTTLESPQQ